ncbi:hypothetical protein FJT64_016579 [Amphibalanus amphitrite]|uniref:Uncharacterized protein n=1 Tax=Amphibalanus amphitrite TaxID=1232801 RepID=A0A6A4X5D4_AMPAM|nr:uncharacterized protein LOC122382220 [Amphibalanus amphitrite]KAF0312709.1 hypothetical protein FJT64_016579 [Amphibalanus amphitrite]
MTFVRVKIGEFEVIANADCYAAMLLDWLRQRVGDVLGGGPLEGALDLCDETGGPRLLWALPPRVNTLQVLTPRAVYYLVVRRQPGAVFKLVRPIGRPELLRAVHDRLKRAVSAWGRARAKLAADVSQEQLVETVNQCISQQATRNQRRSARPQHSADKWHKLRDKVEHEIAATDNHLTDGHLRARMAHLKV